MNSQEDRHEPELLPEAEPAVPTFKVTMLKGIFFVDKYLEDKLINFIMFTVSCVW